MILLKNSNQPYLYYNEKKEKCLLYCYADKLKTLFFGEEYHVRPWKIKLKNFSKNTDQYVNTPNFHPEHGEVVIECNPHFYLEDNKVNLCYVAGFNLGPNEPICYHVSVIPSKDLSFNELDLTRWKLIRTTFTGSVIDNFIITNKFEKGIRHRSTIIKKHNNSNEIQEIDFLKELNLVDVLKINKIFDKNIYIITGQLSDNSVGSFLLDQNFNLIKQILNSENQSVYKCTILENKIIYTVRDEKTNTPECRYLIEENYTIDN